MIRIYSFFLVLVIVANACNTLHPARQEQYYRKAIENSMYANPQKTRKLIEITKENPLLVWKTINQEDYVLMLTWKAKNYYPAEGLYNTDIFETWVTAVPELYNKMKHVKVQDQAMRLKQLLGLPPSAQNCIFIEFWVRPVDLFRPCPDKEITDQQCNCSFSSKDSTDNDYIQWFNKGRIDRYYANGLYNQYPWTQLGYTYDWHPKNKSHTGVSEFVIGKNKNIYVHKSYTTEEYLKK